MMVSIAYHNDLNPMVDEYASYFDFIDVMSVVTMGKTQDPYEVSDGYLFYGDCLCITNNLRETLNHMLLLMWGIVVQQLYYTSHGDLLFLALFEKICA